MTAIKSDDGMTVTGHEHLATFPPSMPSAGASLLQETCYVRNLTHTTITQSSRQKNSYTALHGAVFKYETVVGVYIG